MNGFSVIGLTGTTGAGKGAVSACFRQVGIPTLDTDLVSRAVTGIGMPCTRAYAEAFGHEILSEDGALLRSALANIVFGEKDVSLRGEKLATLNRISHYYILNECRAWLYDRFAEGFHCAVIDAPQLFESGFDRECDRILAVSAPKDIRLSRIMARDGLSEERALARIRAQHDDDFFHSHADAVISNDGEKSVLYDRLMPILSMWGVLS